MLVALDGKHPDIDPTAYVHSSVHVIGDVVVGPGSSLWFGTVVRGDVHSIRIGARTNIQDNSVVHVTRERFATHIGDDVTVGHRAVVHGCTVGDRCLIGIGAIVMDGVEVGEDCIVGAGALVAPGTRIPPGSVVLGQPGRVARAIRPTEREHILATARHYADQGARYRAQGIV